MWPVVEGTVDNALPCIHLSVRDVGGSASMSKLCFSFNCFDCFDFVLFSSQSWRVPEECDGGVRIAYSPTPTPRSPYTRLGTAWLRLVAGADAVVIAVASDDLSSLAFAVDVAETLARLAAEDGELPPRSAH